MLAKKEGCSVVKAHTEPVFIQGDQLPQMQPERQADRVEKEGPDDKKHIADDLTLKKDVSKETNT